MSRWSKVAKFVVKNRFLTNKLFDFLTQLIIHAPSIHLIKQSKSLANTLGRERNSTSKLNAEQIKRSLGLLRCFELPDSEFIRIGPFHDGGYVVYRDVKSINKLISIGVAEDTAFEEDFSRLNPNLTVYLYDHTATPKRELPDNFNFHSTGLGPKDSTNLLTLDTIIYKHVQKKDKVILKIDIEGSEYEALATISEDSYKLFEQIIIELHDINETRLISSSFTALLEEIRKEFYLVHIHGNNNDGFVMAGGAAVPQTLELTFLSKRYGVKEVIGSAIFPRSIDYPCATGIDLQLGAFRFSLSQD